MTDAEDRRWSRHWWEHYAVVFLVWLNIALGLAGFLPDVWWAGTINTAGFALILIGLLFVYSHLRHMCIRCIIESPADAPAAAQRNHYWLRVWHLANESWTVIVLIWTAILFGDVIPGLLHAPHIVGDITGMLIALVLAATWHSDRVHRGLVVFCPWCKGRGEPEEVPTPDPVVSASS